MEKIRIRLNDGTFASVPRVAKIAEGSEYVWFKGDGRHVYVLPATGGIGWAPNDCIYRAEVDEYEECSVDEFNKAVRDVMENKFICNEYYQE